MEHTGQSVKKKAHLKLLAMRINTYLKPPPGHSYNPSKTPPQKQQNSQASASLPAVSSKRVHGGTLKQSPSFSVPEG